MTDREICLMYREAKYKSRQLQILAELNNTDRNKIIKILLQNGERLPSSDIRRLYNRLNVLDAQISEKEKEYREIVQVLKSREAQSVRDTVSPVATSQQKRRR